MCAADQEQWCRCRHDADRSRSSSFSALLVRQKTTEAGPDALGYFHERKDENRNVGFRPEHDWSSHAADGFGYMAISYEEPPAPKSEKAKPARRASPTRSFWSA
jgi:hypothetical protein